jgi:HEAT repeat protein
MSDIKRTVHDLLRDSDPRARLFAIDLVMRSPHLFEPVELVERLKLAADDADEEVAQKARLSMSALLARGFREEGLIRDLGINSRIASATPVELKLEQSVRDQAADLLATAMGRAVALAKDAKHPAAPSALDAIGRSRNTSYAKVLLQATAVPELEDRAFEALRHFRSEAGLALAQVVLAEAKTESQMARAADVIGSLTMPDGVEILRPLAAHKSELVRKAAARALGMIRGDASEALLIAMLDDRAPAVLLVAIGALGEIGRERGVDALLDRYNLWSDSRVQSRCLSTFALLHREKTLPLIIDALSSKDPRIRANAVEAVACFPLSKEEAGKHLTEFLADPTSRVRANAIVSLYPHDHARGTRALREMLASKAANERASAYWAVGQIQDIEVVEAFVNALGAEGEKASLASGMATLDRLTNPRLKPAVQRLFGHSNHTVQIHAIQAYGRLAGGSALKVLDRMYGTAETEVIKSAILMVMGEVCEPGNIQFITKHFTERGDRLLANAIEALDLVGSLENSVLLEPFLAHPSPRVRANAAVALWRMGSFSSLDTLTELLASADEATVRTGLYALGRVQSSMDWRDLKRRPMLLSSLQDQARSMTAETRLEDPPSAEPPPADQTDQTTPLERDLALAMLAVQDHAIPKAKELLRGILESEPANELACFLLARLEGTSSKASPIPDEALEATYFLPLLAAESKRAQASRNLPDLLTSHFRIFERQLGILQLFVDLGREYLAAGTTGAARDIAKFIVTQIQWTQDLDLRLGLIFVQKQDWPRAYFCFQKAYLNSGGDAAIGVYLGLAALKSGKLSFARMILDGIVRSPLADADAKARAKSVAKALGPVGP